MAWICSDGGFDVDHWWPFRPGFVEWGGVWSGWGLGSELAPVGSVEVEVAWGSFYSPPSFVDQGVVMPAEEDQIFEARKPSFGPWDEMVDVTPAGGPVASGEDAMEVTGHDCDSQGRGDQSFGPSHVEGLAVGSEYDPGQIGVTGEPSDLVGGEEGPTFGFGDAGFGVEEGFGGDMDDETGPVGVRFDHFEEEVGSSGGNIAGVTGKGRTGVESGGAAVRRIRCPSSR